MAESETPPGASTPPAQSPADLAEAALAATAPAAATPAVTAPAVAAPAQASQENPTPPAPAAPAVPSKASQAAEIARQRSKAAIQGAALKVKEGSRSVLLNLILFPLLIFRGSLATRLLMTGFVLSVLALGVSTVGILRAFKKYTPAAEERVQGASKNKMEEYLQKEKDLNREAENMVFLERYSAGLNSKSGKVHVYELDVWVECEEPETCELIEEHKVWFKEGVAASVQNKRYEELQEEAGRDRLREEIRGSIHKILEKHGTKGKVLRVFFPRFVMAPS